ncbi:MAG: hypothetical protein HOQ03_10635 [Thermoleophilia bacterium]|nr:hypothetical protein [Thermoleophilia bacterium]
MQPELHSRMASERLKDDHDGLRPEDDGTATLEPESITIRPLREGDVAAVELLAELEERPVPPGPLLLADVDGTVEAAIGLAGGETVANPFSESAGAVSLLHLRAAQLRAA